MTLFSKPFTCDCILDLTNKKIVKRCKLHKTARNIQVVFEHAARFSHANETDEKQNELRQKERDRIRRL